MDLLESLIIVSEKAANIARLCRQNLHLFKLLIQQKSSGEANPRFVEDFKTLADVLIQQMVKHEIGSKFPELKNSIKGEENNIFSNKLGETICVEIKNTPEETSELLEIVLNGDKQAAELLSLEVHKNVFLDEVAVAKPRANVSNADLSDMGVWIDPIDSTAEYINGIENTSATGISLIGLKCVTVLIGVHNKESGDPIIGVVNQPFFEQKENSQWQGRCYWGLPGESSLSSSSVPVVPKIICVSSSEDQEILRKFKDKGFVVVEAAGAGYKLLTVITGQAGAYVLTKSSTFKWDTCGPQAILRSMGGDVVIYNEAVQGSKKSVEYKGQDKCNAGGIVAYRNSEMLNDVLNCLKEK